MARLRNILSVSGLVRYWIWKKRGFHGNLHLRLRNGLQAVTRPRDFNIFYEVFVKQVYDPPTPLDPEKVLLILDLGGNLGFSVLYWLSKYPNARVTVYEPHPEHVQFIQRQLTLNGFEKRAIVRPVAAGPAESRMYLNDKAAGSTVDPEQLPGSIPVEMRDVFSEITDLRFDIVKIDIEGGEYPLMDDPRFARLHAKTICMEAHPNPSRGLDEAGAVRFAIDLLSGLGYQAKVHRDIIWATRQ